MLTGPTSPPRQVAFGTLAFLVAARVFKKATKTKRGLGWLKFVPEILVGVVITTRACARLPLP